MAAAALPTSRRFNHAERAHAVTGCCHRPLADSEDAGSAHSAGNPVGWRVNEDVEAMSTPAPPGRAPDAAAPLLDRVLHGADRRDRLTHLEIVPARPGTTTDWPDWVPALLVDRLRLAGVERPWEHQAAAADLAWSGRSVVLATGTASGKSLAYLLPVLAALLQTPAGDGASALYLAPTKALAGDQLRAVRALNLTAVRAAAYDGDTPAGERDWVRSHANLILTNPDMLHRSLLPQHQRWSRFLRRLRFIVIDECHGYRGVFGSHVAQVLRRLQRVAARHGADPVAVLASATVAEPETTAARLLGREVVAVSADASPRGPLEFALWEPPLLEGLGEHGAPLRRSAVAETGELLADLVSAGLRTVAFVRSRRGAEAAALAARRVVAEIDDALVDRVAAYRAGYLASERRALEQALHSGRILGLASTNALELGIDVSGLDAVLMAGWPGTRASLWQQAGRAGRSGGRALAVLVARDDPLDTYLVHHPEALFGAPVEAAVLDPDNPYVLGPHLCAAAAELPLTDGDVTLFGPTTPVLLADLVRRGLLRHRPTGWFWTKCERAADLVDLRGSGGRPVSVVEDGTGRLVGTVDSDAAHSTVHRGAVYLHQGDAYIVLRLDLEEAVALVRRHDPGWSTMARDLTDIAVVDATRSRRTAEAELHFGTVDVTNQVVSFQRRRLDTREVIGEEPLDLPPRQLRTRAVWWQLSPRALATAGVDDADLAGAAHAAEHASIGLLPLFATCDRWDIGGVSTALHPDTGMLTVFVYDGHPGGAGFAERGFRDAGEWLGATRAAVEACACEAGCPSCVQSPKCGNGNEPLHKAGAVRLLDRLLQSLG